MEKRPLKICNVPGYIYRNTGKEITRQTVYRWINVGKQLRTAPGTFIKLETYRVCGQLFTKRLWVDHFLRRISQ